ncbi:MAG: YbaK/EbsC family protein [Lachnospiraceae bacterium]|nr:YbaK/EbsC family protein [Lachnospiraceae bacterium]
MSIEKAKAYLEEKGFLEHVIEFEESTATVALAAEAVGVEPGRIAKTMSFLVGEEAILILIEGMARVDNKKFKNTFHVKAKMIPYDQVEEWIGHAPGGVCPFGIKDGVKVYLDESLKRFDTVYPAAGNDHSAVNLTIAELEQASGAAGWVNVCKEPVSEV